MHNQFNHSQPLGRKCITFAREKKKILAKQSRKLSAAHRKQTREGNDASVASTPPPTHPNLRHKREGSKFITGLSELVYTLHRCCLHSASQGGAYRLWSCSQVTAHVNTSFGGGGHQHNPFQKVIGNKTALDHCHPSVRWNMKQYKEWVTCSFSYIGKQKIIAFPATLYFADGSKILKSAPRHTAGHVKHMKNRPWY